MVKTYQILNDLYITPFAVEMEESNATWQEVPAGSHLAKSAQFRTSDPAAMQQIDHLVALKYLLLVSTQEDPPPPPPAAEETHHTGEEVEAEEAHPGR